MGLTVKVQCLSASLSYGNGWIGEY